MKKNTFCIVAMLFATISFAQEFRGHQRREFNPEEMATWQTVRLQQALQLDSTQYQVIFLMNYADAVTMQDSMKARRERAEKMRAEGKKIERPTEEQMKARMEIQKEREQIRNEQMKQILTAEQYEKYLKYNEELKERMRRGPGNRNGRLQRSERPKGMPGMQ